MATTCGEDPHALFFKAINTPLNKFGDGFKCAICIGLYEQAVMLPCTHSMCSGCAEEWLKLKNECPVCKKKVAYICY
jgi:hypothetical protein